METWKQIKDLEHTKYMISDKGNVKNKDTNYILEKHDKTGYSTVLITHEGKSSTHRLHVLVAKSFLINNNPKNIVNHIDGDKLNNNLDNLEYISQSDNVKHAYENKLLIPNTQKLSTNKISDTIEFNSLIYRIVPNFPDYSATINGKVYSHKSKRFIKGQINFEGYVRIGLYKDGNEKKLLVHRIIAETFILNPENKAQVNHKDMNKSNNSVENLEWITNRENKIHSLNNYRVTTIITFPIDLKQMNKNLLKAQIEITMSNKEIKNSKEEISKFIKLLGTKLIQ